MLISMIFIVTFVFSFTFWFKRSEKTTGTCEDKGYAVSKKSSLSTSFKFAFFMTVMISLQWLALTMVLHL